MENSYDRNAKVPKVGTRWMWEIDKPHARALIEVLEVIWNGEEWWIRTRSIMEWMPPSLQRHGGIALNDVGRFWEAVTPVGGPLTARFHERHQVEPDIERSWGTKIPVA